MYKEIDIIQTWDISKNEEDNVTAQLDEKGTLTISGTGAMKDFGYNNQDVAEWHSKVAEINSIIIEEGVTNIGERTFMRCTNIVNVQLPSTIENIGIYAFNSCNNLESIEINSYFELDSSVFLNCDKLTKLIITEKVQEFNTYLFTSLEKLETIEIDSLNTCFKIIDGIFYDYNVTELIGCSAGKKEASQYQIQ